MYDHHVVIKHVVMEIITKGRILSDAFELEKFIEDMVGKIFKAVRAQDCLLTETQVAQRWSFLDVKKLRNLRARGGGPQFVKFGPYQRSRVYYRVSAIENWIVEHEGFSPFLKQS